MTTTITKNAMLQIPRRYSNDQEFRYTFTVYLENGDKAHLDYFDNDGMRQMRQYLTDKNEAFVTLEADADNFLTEVR